MAPTPIALNIRTYQVGFGDCFLLSFRYADQEERHVLIDFGSTSLPEGTGQKHMLSVANDIAQRTNNKLHAIVATHRHKDHISGFATAKGKGPGDVIARLKPDLVVQPWTEDPDAASTARTATKSPRRRSGDETRRAALHVASLQEMHGVAEAAVRVTKRMRKALDYDLADRLQFVGDDNIKNRSAVENLIAMGKGGKARYVSAGAPSGLEDVLPGVKVHVLGPPTIEQTDTIRKQRSRDTTEFWHFWRRHAAAGNFAAGSSESDGEPLFPKHVQKELPPSIRWFRQRLTEAHADSLWQIVRILDDAMNNTSVILLFEVGGKRLLFPGDAQIENWQYALSQPEWKKLLEGVDVYKVGHHGSLNATPKTSLWPLITKRGKGNAKTRLKTLLSTMSHKHGDEDSGTEVPRKKLVDALKSDTELFSTEELVADEKLYEDTVIPLGRAPKAPTTKLSKKSQSDTPPPADPLASFGRPPPKGKRTPIPFESGEHAWLGNAGAKMACEELRAQGINVSNDDFLAIRRLHEKTVLQYGELVALSGDFYESPSDVYEERPSKVPWLWESNDVSDLRSMFRTELDWIEERQRGKDPVAYPDQNVRFAWNAKSYVELALKNVDHFGWHNLVAYCRYHTAALELAAAAKGNADERWARARVYNAFADHFLTDGFAAGHLRVPRAEIITWAQGKGYSDKLAGALSKLLHDQDGHVSTLHGKGDLQRVADDGLPVRNSKGARWRTFCDGQLFLFPGANTAPHVQYPARAVAESVKELVIAWTTGKVPNGRFAATEEVPFPDPASPTLSQKFPESMPAPRLKALHESVAWYVKVPWLSAGLKPEHLKELFTALPELMAAFRANVETSLQRDPTLLTRLPPAYIDAYRTLDR